MSPRREYLMIEDWPKLSERKIYSVKVLSLRQDKKAGILQVETENEDKSQYGRRHTIELPLPVHPTGPTAEFLKACGISMEPGHRKIYLDTVVGCYCTVKFNREGHATDFFKSSPQHEPVKAVEED